MIGKKAKFNMFDNWAEFFGFILLVIGFLIAISAGSAMILYIISLLFGGIFGRWWFRFKKKLKSAVAVILLGALIGLTAGAIYGDRRIVILLFVVGFAISYYVHDKGYLHSAEY